MLKTNHLILKKNGKLKKLKKLWQTWTKNFKLNLLFKLLIISKWSYNYYLNLHKNNGRNKKPKIINPYFKVICLKFITKLHKKKKVDLSENFIKFDFVNRLYFKIWTTEFIKIRKKRKSIIQFKGKNKLNINFPILKYKLVIRNTKLLNKKRQKILNYYNLGFFTFEYFIYKQKIKRLNRRIFNKPQKRFFLIKE